MRLVGISFALAAATKAPTCQAFFGSPSFSFGVRPSIDLSQTSLDATRIDGILTGATNVLRRAGAAHGNAAAAGALERRASVRTQRTL